MSQVQIIINQIIILALLGLTGFIAGKKKVLPEDSHKYISAFILKITTPLLIFTTMGNYSFTSETIKNGMYIFIFGMVFMLIAGAVSLGPCKVMNIKDKTKNIYISQSMFGNVIFMAYPLLKAMFGDIGIVYAIFYNLANDGLLWTLGVYLFNRHNKKKSWKDNLSHLVNPNTMAFIGGIGMIASKTLFKIDNIPGYNKVWEIFYAAFNGLGHTTIYLSMVFIGLILSSIKINGVKDILSKFRYFVHSMFKLLIIPLIAVAFFALANGFFDPFVKRIVVLQLAMPASTVVSALALEYDSDYIAATEEIFISTILSIFTLPFIVYMIM